MLVHLAQEAKLPGEIDLWPAIQARLATGNTFSPAMKPKMRANFSTIQTNRVIFIAMLTLVLALGMIAAIPQGRALASHVLRFFIPSQGDSFPLPPQDATPNITTTPTFALPMLAGCEDPSAAQTYRCAITRAEATLGFDVRELPSDPEGFTFINAFPDPHQSLVRLTYARDGGELTITQVLATARPSAWEASWGAVPVDSIEKVQIHDVEGEYVRGMFVVKSQTGTKAEWEPDAPVQRLRWREADRLFEISMYGLPGYDDRIGKAWLIALAESLK